MMKWPENTTFEDSTLRAVRSAPGTLMMEFEDVFSNRTKASFEVIFEGVHDLTEDDSPCQELTMEMPDAEVLTFEEMDGWIDLIVLWRDYRKHLSSTKAYRFRSKTGRFRLLPPAQAGV